MKITVKFTNLDIQCNYGWREAKYMYMVGSWQMKRQQFVHTEIFIFHRQTMLTVLSNIGNSMTRLPAHANAKPWHASVVLVANFHRSDMYWNMFGSCAPVLFLGFHYIKVKTAHISESFPVNSPCIPFPSHLVNPLALTTKWLPFRRVEVIWLWESKCYLFEWCICFSCACQLLLQCGL